MRLAAVSDDGTTISLHFGRARLYVVVGVEGGEVTHTETRTKLGHEDFGGGGHGPHEPGQRRGHGRGARARHTAMMEAISDCRALLARGMGWGACEALSDMGIDAVVTDVADVGEATRLYARGELPNLRERLH